MEFIHDLKFTFLSNSMLTSRTHLPLYLTSHWSFQRSTLRFPKRSYQQLNLFIAIVSMAYFSKLHCVYATSSTDIFDQYDKNQDQEFDFYCYSCASLSYLSLWNDHLMGHYYPPKNFTEGCWKPHLQVGVTSCRSACFTIVEELYDHTNQDSAVLRGCLDRFLLFGLDADIKKAITNINSQSNCRTIDRTLLNLVSLSQDIPLVLICTCKANLCNADEVQSGTSSLFGHLLLTLLLCNSLNFIVK
ncbi:hypothetical protein M3Y98_00295500 [Aphelenchoides besseyi]|nr:hypothetical protein M3Y98_00295500 [Aphelenchoides besseyi]KAI6201171.1 hypothetical protein M3Y96_00813500 [Aphelenchoides besseyi]